MKSSRRVVITGMGVISPMGNTTEALWQSLLAGRSAVGPIQSFPVDHLPTKFAAEARDFTGSIDDFGPLEAEKKKAIRKGLKLMCRESQMGVAAAQRALTDAGLGETGKCDPERTGVVFGSDYMITLPEDFTAGILRCIKDGEFDFSEWATQGMPQVTPLWLLKYLPNMPASHVAIYNDFRGPNNSITLREASANAAVGEAFRTIARGSADVMLAGATGTRVHPMKMVHTVLQEEVASETDPERASRPFDLNRMGMVLGEGAAAIILEELSCAQARGATVYGEIVGTACGTVSARNGVAHRETALTNVMRRALDDAECTPREIGHVHAHGLSTRSCDEDEAKAVRLIFGDHARKVPVTAAKSYFGNLGAASGLIEMVSSVLAVKHQRLFKVLNHETTDPRCPLSVIRSEDDPGASFLTINVTPQGQASALVVRAVA
ncbi:MAG TPA: beta-ketoacyl-[acyl-carrier-protein] synthase family protein [Pirellulales bacterium]